MRVALYGRFSSDQQNAKSADDQLALCRQHAERQGWTVVASFKDEAVSGASVIGRFGLENMLKAARANQFDLILVEAIDRLSRDQGDIGTIRKSLKFWGIGLHTLADGKVNSITAGIRGLLAETFLEELAAKTRRGLAAVTKDGRHAGGRSYGYRPVVGRPGELEIVPEQAEVVREIFEMVARGTMPRVIATTLNARGVPGPRGAAWNASTIYGSRTRANGILNNSLYIGEIVWNRQTFVKDPDTGRRVSRPNGDGDRIVTPAPHLRIVSDELWAAVAGRKRNKTPQTARLQAPRHMFSGLIKCADRLHRRARARHLHEPAHMVAPEDRDAYHRRPAASARSTRGRGRIPAGIHTAAERIGRAGEQPPQRARGRNRRRAGEDQALRPADRGRRRRPRDGRSHPGARGPGRRTGRHAEGRAGAHTVHPSERRAGLPAPA
jgi:DNA invertase Pin-like site-specific DNA recombinase